MSHLSHRVGLLVLSAAFAATSAACAADTEETTVQLGSGSETAARTPAASPPSAPQFGPLTGVLGHHPDTTVNCPPARGPALAVYQQKATEIAAYMLGGEKSPIPAPPSSGYDKCGVARQCIGKLREALGPAPARPNVRDPYVPMTVSSPFYNPDVCGLPASTFEITVDGELNDEQAAYIEGCAASLDSCFASGVSGFFYVQTEGYPSKHPHVFIDPQPAQATASLGGSTGATAAAVYVNDATPTSILKWTSSYSPGSTAAAGTPCSVTDLGVNETVVKVIQVFGSNRRCF